MLGDYLKQGKKENEKKKKKKEKDTQQTLLSDDWITILLLHPQKCPLLCLKVTYD